MRRSIALSMALLLACPTVHATQPAARAAPAPYQQLRSQRMAELAPGLRQWVVGAGRRNAQAPRDVGAIGSAVRDRLAGQAFSDADVDALVQLVLIESAAVADADLRDQLAKMKSENERKKAARESTQQPQGQRELKHVSRDSLEHRAQPPQADIVQADGAPSTTRPSVQEDVDAAEAEKDSLSELGEEEQLKLQMYQDRYAQFVETLSNLMKKNSETASSITANLK